MGKKTSRKENFPMGLLKLREDNRKIIRKHVEELKKSINENGYMDFKPIIVDKDNTIIDGQHRYIACQELGIEAPVLTVDGNAVAMMVTLNKTQKAWGINDFINFHAECGNKSYITLREFIKETGLSPTPAIILLTDERGFFGFDNVKEGNLKIELTQEQFDEYVEIAQAINKIAKLMKLVKGNKLLTQTYLSLLKIEGFDQEYFFDKILRYRDELHICGSLKAYLQMFVNIYNYNKKGYRITL